MTVTPEAPTINPEKYAIKAPKGLSREVVEMISKAKDEPQWTLDSVRKSGCGQTGRVRA